MPAPFGDDCEQSLFVWRSGGGAGRGLSNNHTAIADTSSSAEPTPAAIASPPVKASLAAANKPSALSAGSPADASTAAASDSRARDATASGVPGGIANPRYTAVMIEPSVAIPSAMPSS